MYEIVFLFIFLFVLGVCWFLLALLPKSYQMLKITSHPKEESNPSKTPGAGMWKTGTTLPFSNNPVRCLHLTHHSSGIETGEGQIYVRGGS